MADALFASYFERRLLLAVCKPRISPDIECKEDRRSANYNRFCLSVLSLYMWLSSSIGEMPVECHNDWKHV